jgi:hypothetical protein
MTETGIAPDASLNTLLGLAVTGEAEGRIAAARALTDLFEVDPTARDRVPPPLATLAETMAQLAEPNTIPPNDIVNTVDTLFETGTPSLDDDKSNPAVILLAKAQHNASLKMDGESPAEGAEGDEDIRFDEDNLFFDDDGNDNAVFAEGRVGGNLQLLLSRVNRGDPADRIAAAHELSKILKSDPSARGTLPPELIARTEMLTDLAFADPLSPDKIGGQVEAIPDRGEESQEPGALSSQAPFAPFKEVLTDATADQIAPD